MAQENVLKKELVGLTKEEAVAKLTAAGSRYRIRMVDGQGCVGTCDYRLDRFNLILENNIVTKVTMG